MLLDLSSRFTVICTTKSMKSSKKIMIFDRFLYLFCIRAVSKTQIFTNNFNKISAYRINQKHNIAVYHVCIMSVTLPYHICNKKVLCITCVSCLYHVCIMCVSKLVYCMCITSVSHLYHVCITAGQKSLNFHIIC